MVGFFYIIHFSLLEFHAKVDISLVCNGRFCGYCFPWHIKQVTSITGKSTHVGESTKAWLNLFASVCYCYLTLPLLSYYLLCVIEVSFFASYLYLLIIYFKLL